METSLDGVSRGDKELCSETLRVRDPSRRAHTWERDSEGM